MTEGGEGAGPEAGVQVKAKSYANAKTASQMLNMFVVGGDTEETTYETVTVTTIIMATDRRAKIRGSTTASDHAASP